MNTDLIIIGVLLMLGGLAGLALLIAYLLTLQRALERCAPRNRTVSPGKVWLSLIPLFNIVWQFILVSRIAETLRREFDFRGVTQPASQDDYGRGVGLAMCVLAVISFIPLVGIPTGLAGCICWIVYWVKISGYSKTLEMAITDTAGVGLASEGEPPQFQESRTLGAQWLVLLVLVFGWGASYFQRNAFSVLAPLFRGDLAVSSVQLGWAFSAFMFGLMTGHVFLTVVTALCGTRWGLVAAFAGMSLSACASGAFPNITGIIVARFLLGFFTGGLLPAAIQSAREWFPSRLRPLVIGAILTAGPAALLLAPLLVVFLSHVVGWRLVLILTGIPTAITAVLCIVAWPSPPGRETFRGVSAAAWASTGMLALGLFFAAPVSSFVLTFLLTYLRNYRDVSLQAVAVSGVLVLVAGCCGALLAGAIAWAATGAGTSSSKVRAAMLSACGCLLPLVPLSGVMRDSTGVIVLAALSAAAFQGWSTLLYSAVADTLPARGVAVAAAFGALMLDFSGMVSPLAFGQMIQRSGGFQPVFLTVAATALVALLGVALLAWLVRQEPVG